MRYLIVCMDLLLVQVLVVDHRLRCVGIMHSTSMAEHVILVVDAAIVAEPATVDRLLHMVL